MFKKIFLALFIICFFVSCNNNLSLEQKLENSKNEILEKNKDFLGGLTKDQMIEDYEYMWKTLKEGYPYFGVAKRLGIDNDKIYKDYKEKIEKCSGDGEFVNTIFECTKNYPNIGHLGAVLADYNIFKNAYKDDVGNIWYETLNNPKSSEFYEKFYKLNDEIIEAKGEILQENNTYGNNETDDLQNVNTRIIKQDKIAYIKVNSFLINDNTKKDYETILSFFDEVKNYDNLIIDITRNSGGSDYYWMYMVSLLIDKYLSYDVYGLFNKSENNNHYLDGSDLIYKSRPINELPEFKNINKDDLNKLTYFYKDTYDVLPKSSPNNSFKGKIWTLVNENVYSASEAFAYFCKSTKFSTLVGTNTGGDGITGGSPVYLVLPNSGMLVRYTMIYGLNPDGSNNEEFGTPPDFISPKGESPLDTCLKIIEN